MVELPNTIYKLVRIVAHTRTGSKGGIYCPVCVQLTFRVWIPRTLRVGKVDVNISLKQPSSAGLMLQDLALLALWVRVQDKSTKTWTNSQVSVSVLCHRVKFTLPYYMPTKQDTNSHSNNGQG